MEEENVDGPDRRHDPDDPPHVGSPGTQLPQVQPARARSAVSGVQGSTPIRAMGSEGEMLPSSPWLSHQRVLSTCNFNLKGLKSIG